MMKCLTCLSDNVDKTNELEFELDGGEILSDLKGFFCNDCGQEYLTEESVRSIESSEDIETSH